MAWWMAIPALLSVAGSISSAASARSEGNRATIYAGYNAIQTRQWGLEQANMIAVAGQYNANQIISNYNAKSALAAKAREYNIAALRSAQELNELQALEEIDSIMDAQELDTELLHVDTAKAIGSTIAQQAGSGTVIGEGSNADVVVAMKAKEALMDLVIDTNAVNAINEVKNGLAIGDFETESAVRKIMWEGELSDKARAIEATSAARSTMFNSIVNASSTLRSAENKATSLFYTGQQQNSAQQAQANSYLFQGLTTGTSLLISGFDKS